MKQTDSTTIVNRKQPRIINARLYNQIPAEILQNERLNTAIEQV